jgi:ABC-type transport system involved in multi-copper enzyme maturation permease subunit
MLRAQGGQVLLLAWLTWKEGLRRRMLLLGFIMTLLFILLYGLGTYYAFRDAGPLGEGFSPPAGAGEPGMEISPDVFRQAAAFQMLVFGIFVTSFLGAMLVCFSAAGMITGDAENGTLQTILTRPVSRLQLMLGRFLGYSSVYLAYLLLLAGSLILITRLFADYAPQAPWESLALLASQGLILLAVISLLSVLLPPLATGIAGFMFFGFAFIGGVVENIGRFLQNGTARDIGRGVSYLLPTDSFFRMGLEGLSPGVRDAFTSLTDLGPLSGAQPQAGRIVYGIAYAAVALFLGILLFRRRDI